MRDVIAELDAWHAAGQRSAVATVVSVKRSAPRPPGAKMAIAQDGSVTGMVSGGCVEGAVIEVAEEVLGGAAPRLLHFGIADAEAWDVGLPCGGEIEVWVDRLDDAPAAAFAELARNGGRGALVTRMDDGRRVLIEADGTRQGFLGDDVPQTEVAALAERLVWLERSEQHELGGVPVFIDVTAPPPRLIIVGAIDLAEALAKLASFSGWRAFVTDPRGRFATVERFPSAERVVAGWPAKTIPELGGIDRATSIVVLTHDPKIDDAALEVALRSDAGYIGVMGSHRMQRMRRERMLELSFTDADLERLSGPVGLDLGALTPQETALAVMAEIIAVRHGHHGGRLKDSTAPRIHEVQAT
ncbi:MAG: XdhC family protein [Solirubrobacterales bacterium]|nr:XdhC family protein [Solirubrobacterales bacterium]